MNSTKSRIGLMLTVRLSFLASLVACFVGSAAIAESVGDCNGDGMTSIAELIVAVNVALGMREVEACEAADVNGNGSVSIGELIQGVNAALGRIPTPTLGGSPGTATGTPTATFSPTASLTATTTPIRTPTPSRTNTASRTPTRTSTTAPTHTATHDAAPTNTPGIANPLEVPGLCRRRLADHSTIECASGTRVLLSVDGMEVGSGAVAGSQGEFSVTIDQRNAGGLVFSADIEDYVIFRRLRFGGLQQPQAKSASLFGLGEPVMVTDTLRSVRFSDIDVSAITNSTALFGGVALTRDGATAYVVDAVAGFVSVVSVFESREIQRIDFAEDPPRDVIVAADRAFVAAGHQVAVIDVGTQAVSSIGGIVSATSLAKTPDDSVLYVVDALRNEVAVIDVFIQSVVDRVPVGLAPLSAVVTPDGALLFVANFGSSTLSAIDVASRTVVQTVHLGDLRPYELISNLDGSLIIGSTSPGPGRQIFVVDTLSLLLIGVFSAE